MGPSRFSLSTIARGVTLLALPHECRVSNAALIFLTLYLERPQLKQTSLSSNADSKSVT